MQQQKPQASVLVKIGKFHISKNAGPYACRKDLVIVVVSSGVAGYGLNAAVNLLLRAAFQGICQEETKGIVLAIHGHAFSAVGLHHRRINFHARRFLDSAARMDDKSIIIFVIYDGSSFTVVSQLRHFLPGCGYVAVDGYIPDFRSKVHIIA